MNDRIFKRIFGILALLLFLGLVYKLIIMPGGMILPGFILGGMVLFGVIIVCLFIAKIVSFVFKYFSFITIFSIVTSIVFFVMNYIWYSPTLKIIVPKNYKGQVVLVSSNVANNILTVDSNGIGYITEWTFDKTYTVPYVIDQEGNNLDSLCVGFNPSTFWAKGTASSTAFAGNIEYLEFEIASPAKAGQKQNYSKDFTNYVDKTKLSRDK
jgi:hypothetical protein